ncbi:PREDICTED: probable phosphatase phospho2 [Nicrophorus vespilloides]|uniref:Probable phosphatase phospho2 n=1 Tax=Nicrophorus vespilloides TaxID=110193 RepID=A0ABM1MLI5_NICVS|nr:PREDICTED: probable phosphatase phospho2 [Nicrophorus vespilloides]
MARKLAAFDFDHTIVEGNSDIVVRDLISKESIPDSVRKLYKNDGWTAYMQGIFELLHLQGHKESVIAKVVGEIPATKGISELIHKLKEENYDVIIISDANSFLINTWLEHNNLKDCIHKVFTNPAKFVNGLLKIEMYHLQQDCKLSTKNLCKGKILEDFIKGRELEGVAYEKTVYVGDGNNDFCPMLRLNDKDLACVRDKYSCLQLINKVKEGKPIPSTGLIYTMKAHVLVWNTGFDILDHLSN